MILFAFNSVVPNFLPYSIFCCQGYYLKVAFTKKTRNNKCWFGGGEKGILVQLWKIVWRILKRLKISTNQAVISVYVYIKARTILSNKIHSKHKIDSTDFNVTEYKIFTDKVSDSTLKNFKN